ncbi:MAG: lipopolysaccharide biosynthesis protein [Acidobacteriia bacterium]|nr:lipopolysaccharide biosynthesis protein [Terriglobia bacterium]
MRAQPELTLDDHLGILRRQWKLLVLLALIGTIGSYLVSRLIPASYTSETMVLVDEPTVPDEFVKSIVGGDLNRRLASMQEQILSRTRLQRTIEQFGLYKKDIGRVPMEQLVERLQKAITVTPLKPTPGTQSRELPGFTVSVVAESPQVAQKICADITDIFMKQNLHIRQQQAEDTTQFLSKQLGEAKGKLDEQDATLAAFKRRYAGSLPEDMQSNMNLLTGMTPQLEAVTQSLNRAEQEKAFNESVLNQQLATWKSMRQGKSPETHQEQLIALENLLASLRARYTDDHPDVIKAKNDIAQLRKELREESNQMQGVSSAQDVSAVEPAQIQQLRAQLRQSDMIIKQKLREQEQLQQKIRALQDRVQATPQVEQEYKSLTRDYQTAFEMYTDLLKKQNQSEMATDLERRQQGEQFRVLDAPSLPQRPSFPKRSYFALGGFAGGLLLGLGLAYGIELQNTALRTERDVELLLGVPALALIPKLKPSRGHEGEFEIIRAEESSRGQKLEVGV